MTEDARARPQPPLLVIMGVSGCGKSTVAGILAGQLDWDLAEGDDLHPAANVAKMAAGVPLTAYGSSARGWAPGTPNVAQRAAHVTSSE